jgi:transcriptional regulator with XRE-family HTH domain
VDLDSLLGINEDDPRDRLADYIVSADEQLMAELVARREELGLTQQDIASRMGINKSNVSRLERGDRDLLQSTLRRYLMALDAVVIHEVRAFEDVDCARKARRHFETHPVDYSSAATLLSSRTFPDNAAGGPEFVSSDSIRPSVYA